METKTGKPRTATVSRSSEELPYCIELWDAADRDAVERVLARAFNVQLARAIFEAAKREHPERRVSIRKGTRVLADSAE